MRRLLILSTLWLASIAPAESWRVEVEGNLAWQGRNDARIPGEGGTLFSLKPFRSGAVPTGRVSAVWNITEDHALKAMVLPLQLSGTNTLATPIDFQGSTFAAGIPTEATYRFHSYRLSYRYRIWDHPNWQLRIGFTAKIRNAKVALSQSGVSAEKSDLGFVPLLHFQLGWRLADSLRLELEGDALAAPQGRAEDISALLWFSNNPQYEWGLGYRMIEGGADNRSVYTFAWLHFLCLNAAIKL